MELLKSFQASKIIKCLDQDCYDKFTSHIESINHLVLDHGIEIIEGYACFQIGIHEIALVTKGEGGEIVCHIRPSGPVGIIYKFRKYFAIMLQSDDNKLNIWAEILTLDEPSAKPTKGNSASFEFKFGVICESYSTSTREFLNKLEKSTCKWEIEKKKLIDAIKKATSRPKEWLLEVEIEKVDCFEEAHDAFYSPNLEVGLDDEEQRVNATVKMSDFGTQTIASKMCDTESQTNSAAKMCDAESNAAAKMCDVYSQTSRIVKEACTNTIQDKTRKSFNAKLLKLKKMDRSTQTLETEAFSESPEKLCEASMVKTIHSDFGKISLAKLLGIEKLENKPSKCMVEVNSDKNGKMEEIQMADGHGKLESDNGKYFSFK